MKNNLLLSKDNLSSLLKKVKNSVPTAKELKDGFIGKYREFKDEALSVKKKSRNLLATNIDLGLYHFYRGGVSEARFRFWLISIFYSHLPVVHYNIGRCHFVKGNIKKALDSFNKALSLDRKHEEADYYVKKITAPERVACIPSGIVRQYFDYTGEYFVERWLIDKRYLGHEYVHTLIDGYYGDLASQIDVLDLGCGTGICGHFLKMKGGGNFITGVDISNRMLNVARGCFIDGVQIYNELVNQDINQFLTANPERKYDVVLLIEVLHYFGNMKDTLALAREKLKEQGIIVGLVRRRDDHDITFIENGDFFCYSLSYVKSVADEVNLRLTYCNHCKIYGNQIEGLLFIMQR